MPGSYSRQPPNLAGVTHERRSKSSKSSAALYRNKKHSKNVAELKRIFVHKEQRGRGLSKILLKELESMALKNGFKKLILETGELLFESINLYSQSLKSHFYITDKKIEG